jgi:hypothetical protein
MATSGEIVRKAFMALENGRVVDDTAFYYSISFNELWKIAPRE